MNHASQKSCPVQWHCVNFKTTSLINHLVSALVSWNTLVCSRENQPTCNKSALKPPCSKEAETNGEALWIERKVQSSSSVLGFPGEAQDL